MNYEAPMSHLPSTYVGLLDELKGRIQAAQTRAGLAVNAELVASTGRSAGPSWSARRLKDGGRGWWTAWPRTSRRPFQP